MNPRYRIEKRRLLCALMLLFGSALQAFPPAPHHTLYGLVRDEWGDPLTLTGAEIIFTTAEGAVRTADIIPGLREGVNYEIHLPIDSMSSAQIYDPTALVEGVPFLVEVRINGVDYLPLEMTGQLPLIGAPAESTQLNLTIGEDSDGDGLPDLWEALVIAMYGGGLTLETLTGSGDIDGDGLSNRLEYIAGTFAWDPMDRPQLTLLSMDSAGASEVEFEAINGRSYTLHASNDMKVWIQVNFSVHGEDAAGSTRNSYFAQSYRNIRAHIPAPTAEPGNGVVWIYRLGVR